MQGSNQYTRVQCTTVEGGSLSHTAARFGVYILSLDNFRLCANTFRFRWKAIDIAEQGQNHHMVLVASDEGLLENSTVRGGGAVMQSLTTTHH